MSSILESEERPMNRQSNAEPPVLGEHGGYEVYPMPVFVRLETADMAATLAWYRDALGFGVMFEIPGPGGAPSFAHIRRKKYQDLLLSPARGSESAADAGLAISFDAEGEVDALWARLSGMAAVGRSQVEAPAATPWNTRELKVSDPDGRRLVFHERANDPEASARMRAMFEKRQAP
jgi:uncharacterized glyoxalase superfamily protein PhnB